jgi:hypothetical protein
MAWLPTVTDGLRLTAAAAVTVTDRRRHFVMVTVRVTVLVGNLTRPGGIRLGRTTVY